MKNPIQTIYYDEHGRSFGKNIHLDLFVKRFLVLIKKTPFKIRKSVNILSYISNETNKAAYKGSVLKAVGYLHKIHQIMMGTYDRLLALNSLHQVRTNCFNENIPLIRSAYIARKKELQCSSAAYSGLE